MVDSNDSNTLESTKHGEQDELKRLSDVFEASAKRWELIVYPSLFFFVLLAGYGFYLVFNLSQDIHHMAMSVDSNMNVMSSNMQVMADGVTDLSINVRTMTASVSDISDKASSLEPMLTNIGSLDESIKSMTASTQHMQNDMSDINNNFSKPMGMMNKFMPW